MYTNRRIFFLIRSHGAAGARSRANTARLHPRRHRRPLPPRRRSLGGDVHISRSCCYYFSSRSRCCSALALGPLPGLLLLLLALLLSLLLVLLLYSCARCCYSTLAHAATARAADPALPRAPAAATRDAMTRPAAPALARTAAATAFLLLVCSVSTVKFSCDSKIQF